MNRPQGEPGTFTFGCGVFDAIRDLDGDYWWLDRIGLWHKAPPAAARKIRVRFEQADVPEWVLVCPHDRICASENECIALELEDEKWADR